MDSHYVYEWTFSILLYLIAVYAMAYFHEAGHYIAAKSTGFNAVPFKFTKHGLINVPISITIETDEIQNKQYQKSRVVITILGGIITGIIPFIIVYLVSPFNETVFLIVFGLYYFIHCCSDDFQQIFNVITGKLDLNS